jgi:hypothetical protein
MIGTKPNPFPNQTHTKPNIPTMIIVRQFRGVQLFLSNVTRAPKDFTWTNNRKQAQRYDAAEALALAYEASRDYGAECATLDVQGNLAQPAVDLVSYDKHGRETSRAPMHLFTFGAKSAARQGGAS